MTIYNCKARFVVYLETHTDTLPMLEKSENWFRRTLNRLNEIDVILTDWNPRGVHMFAAVSAAHACFPVSPYIDKTALHSVKHI